MGKNQRQRPREWEKSPTSTTRAPEGNAERQRITLAVLDVPEVVGVADRGGILVIYLARNSTEATARVLALKDEIAPGLVMDFVISGEFSAL